ncbi:MAG: hypothetical protein HQL48_09820 [Gammaproteobacteria bacterium]|nr:hypothetical protein [Gammaproteobacteria bacterium]
MKTGQWPPWPLFSLFVAVALGFAAVWLVEEIDSSEARTRQPNLVQQEARVTYHSSLVIRKKTSGSMGNSYELPGERHSVEFEFRNRDGQLVRKMINIDLFESHNLEMLNRKREVDRVKNGHISIYTDAEDPNYVVPAYEIDTALLPPDRYTFYASGLSFGLFFYFLYGMGYYLKRALFSGYDPDIID